MNYKKTAFWIITAAVVICIAVAVCFLTDLKTETELSISDEADEIQGTEPETSDTDAGIREMSGSKFAYRYDEELGGIVITKYVREDAPVVIPKIIDNSPVVAIGSSSFSGNNNVTTITLPDSVTFIGYCAFYGCSSLTAIEIPDSVTTIRTNAFYGCDKLTVTYKGRTYDSSNFDELYNLFGYVTESAVNVESDEEQSARAVYTAFLLGDVSMVDDADLGQRWVDFYLSNSELEYVFLDLDGDGVSELIVQWVDDPGSMNATFHYSDGKLYGWNFDTVEATSWESPLKNGIMVYQYHYGGASTWSGFRYLPNGDVEILFTFFARYEVVYDDDTSKVPYYEVDEVEVDQETFDREFKKRITDQELEPPAWTAVPQ